MWSLILVVVGFHFTYGISPLLPQPRTFNFRHYCSGQHSSSKYKVSCDGSSKHFTDKVIFLDGRSVFGLTDIELYSFDSVYILSQSLSDWDKTRNITIRRSKQVVLNVQSSFNLNELKIDSVDELTIETQHPSSSVNIKNVVLTNVGKLNMTSCCSAGINANILSLNNVEDINLFGDLLFLGDQLTVTASNIDVTEHSTMILKFPSIVVKESSKLYIQKGGQSNILTDCFLINESYIYMDGLMNISSYKLGNKKEIKFLQSTFYGMSRNHLHIFGNISEIELNENGIYGSDIGDVLDLFGETEALTFTNNKFGCDKCAKKLNIQAKYLQCLGKQNFCDFSCNLTLTQYKELLDQDKLCHQGKFYVDDNTLCSAISEFIKTKSDSHVYWWTIVVSVISTIVSLIFLSILLYFYCKRHKSRFQSMPVENATVSKLNSNQEDQQVIFRAFNNEIYGRVENKPDNIYEIMDSPRLGR